MTDKSPKEELFDQQWDDLVDDWQSQPVEKVDTNKLIKQLKKRTFYAKFILLLDVVATIGLFWSFIWSLQEETVHMPTTVFLGVGAVGSLIYTILEFKIRIATWQLDASDAEQVFNKNISGLKGAIQYANLWLYSCYIMLPLANWFVWEVGKTTDKSMLFGYLFANGMLVSMFVGAKYYQKLRQKELDNMLSHHY